MLMLEKPSTVLPPPVHSARDCPGPPAKRARHRPSGPFPVAQGLSPPFVPATVAFDGDSP
jgi:hypothetical protein